MTMADWKMLGLGAAAASLVAAGCLYVGYQIGKSKSQVLAALPKGKSYKTASDPLTTYVTSHNTENAVLRQLREFSIGHSRGRMTTSTEVGNLLTILVRSLNARKVLDIGVFTGCSSFALALGLPQGCKVIACDVSKEYTDLGRPYWEEGGVSDKIDLRLQPATKTLQELIDSGEAGTFDMVFIDADKPSYKTYFLMSVELLRTGGLIVVDNALWSGRVADPKIQDSATTGVRGINEAMKNDTRVDFVLLNIDDGMGIGQKLPQPS